MYSTSYLYVQRIIYIFNEIIIFDSTNCLYIQRNNYFHLTNYLYIQRNNYFYSNQIVIKYMVNEI